MTEFEDFTARQAREAPFWNEWDRWGAREEAAARPGALDAFACLLCGQPSGQHHDDTTHAARVSLGLLSLPGVPGADADGMGHLSATVPISHDLLCDYTDHQCTPDCPPLWTAPPVPFWRRVRYGLRRGWWWVTGLRVVHRSRIADDD